MKFITSPRIKPQNRYFYSAFALAIMLLSLALACQNVFAQQTAQLSLADLLIGLRSKKVPLDERNKLLTDAVKVRGITFVLTPEIEKELETTGATPELIEAVRQKSPVIKATPSPTPAATPAPTPAPPDFLTFQRQADAHLVKGEYDLALADYTKVIELNPKSAESYLSRGLSYYYKESYDQAISDYNKGIELAPNESMAYFNRGDSYEKLGDKEKAIADYQKALTINPNNEAAKKALKKLQDEAQAIAEKPKTYSQPRPTETTPPSTAPKSESKDSSKTEPSKIETNVESPLFNLGALTADKAVKMVTPMYSAEARKFKITGQVQVQVNLDEAGNVVFAKAKSGPGLLRAASEDAARKSKFKPAMENGQAVKSTGVIIYDFKEN